MTATGLHDIAVAGCRANATWTSRFRPLKCSFSCSSGSGGWRTGIWKGSSAETLLANIEGCIPKAVSPAGSEAYVNRHGTSEARIVLFVPDEVAKLPGEAGMTAILPIIVTAPVKPILRRAAR